MTNRPKQRGTAAETAVLRYVRDRGYPWAHRLALTGNADQGDISLLPGNLVILDTGDFVPGAWDNEDAPGGVVSTSRGLTRSSDYGREGLAMKATRRSIDPATLTERVMRRIWAKTTTTPSGCIEWTGAKSPNGYGRVGFGGKKNTAVVHRLVLVWATGQDIPEGYDVDHLCRNRACIRPDHLEAVTRRENMRRGLSIGSETIRLDDLAGICPRGHNLRAADAWVTPAGGNRRCRLCVNERARAYRARKALGGAA